METTVTIKTTNYPFVDVIIDAHKYEYVSKKNWQANVKADKVVGVYTSIRTKKEKVYSIPLSHYLLKTKSEVDHIDRNPLNNTIDNLRVVDKFQQAANRGPQANKTGKSSEYKGVSWHKKTNKWYAQFTYLNIRKMKLFNKEINAARWYDKQAFTQYGEFAYLNFPKGDNNGSR